MLRWDLKPASNTSFLLVVIVLVLVFYISISISIISSSSSSSSGGGGSSSSRSSVVLRISSFIDVSLNCGLPQAGATQINGGY